jgi:hypothetical protein
MTDTPEQILWRQHLAEMRRAAHGLGGDFDIYFRSLDDRIGRFSTHAAKDMKSDMRDIEDDLATLAHKIDRELVALPGNVKDRAYAAASAVGAGGSRLAGATRDAFESAGSRAKEGTKNALASAAGVNRKPIKEWHHSTGGSDPEASQ